MKHKDGLVRIGNNVYIGEVVLQKLEKYLSEEEMSIFRARMENQTENDEQIRWWAPVYQFIFPPGGKSEKGYQFKVIYMNYVYLNDENQSEKFIISVEEISEEDDELNKKSMGMVQILLAVVRLVETIGQLLRASTM